MSERHGAPIVRSGVTLLFSATERVGEFPAHLRGYAAAIVDQSGNDLLRLDLPAELVEPVVLGRSCIEVAMSLSGELSADAENIDFRPMGGPKLALDDLVTRAVEPAMLQDEPDAGEQLKLLRQRLETAIVSVDAALSKIDSD